MDMSFDNVAVTQRQQCRETNHVDLFGVDQAHVVGSVTTPTFRGCCGIFSTIFAKLLLKCGATRRRVKLTKINPKTIRAGFGLPIHYFLFDPWDLA